MRNVKLKIHIPTLFVVLLFILQVKFFWILPINAFYIVNSNQQQILMVLVVIYAILRLDGRPLKQGTKSSKILILFFIIYYFVELFISAIKNEQGLVNAFIASNFYLMILGYFIWMYYIRTKKREKFYKIVVIISTLNIIICWLQYLLSFKGIYFTQMSFTNIRFGSLRIGDISETFTSFGIIICVVYFLNKRSRVKWIYFIILVMGLLGSLIVSKGRITILAVFTSICVILLSKYKKNIVKVISTIVITVMMVFIFTQTSFGQVYLKSITEAETDTGSIRIREMQYYNEQTKENIFLGVGFIRDNGDAMSSYLKGPAHQYSRTDIGIWGLANALGIIGVGWYIILTINMIKKIILISRYKKDEHYLIIIGLMTFSLIYIPTMIMMNPYSITSLSILMAIVDRGLIEAKIFSEQNINYREKNYD